MEDESSFIALHKIGLERELDLREYRRRVEVGMAKAVYPLTVLSHGILRVRGITAYLLYSAMAWEPELSRYPPQRPIFSSTDTVSPPGSSEANQRLMGYERVSSPAPSVCSVTRISAT